MTKSDTLHIKGTVKGSKVNRRLTHLELSNDPLDHLERAPLFQFAAQKMWTGKLPPLDLGGSRAGYVIPILGELRAVHSHRPGDCTEIAVARSYPCPRTIHALSDLEATAVPCILTRFKIHECSETKANFLYKALHLYHLSASAFLSQLPMTLQQ